MMAPRTYTREELLHLRDSPLVQKPENLPAIEQWIEYVYVYTGDSREKLRIPHSDASPQHRNQESNHAGRRQQKGVGGGESPMGNFSTGARPGLMVGRRTEGSRSGGEFDRHSAFVHQVSSFVQRRLTGDGAEDISLGPPKTMFPSSRNVAKLSDFDKAAALSGDAAAGEEQDVPRSRFIGDKSNRKSMNEKEGRDNRESWTSARERRALGGDDDQRPEGRDRFSRRDRDQDGERRNGYGDRHDARWGERRQNGERQGGWRERERERRDNRDWDRVGATEKEPEWMDDPTPAGGEDDLRTMGMPRNQEQFQKWKESMSGKKAQPEETEAAPAEPAKETAASKSATAPLKLNGIVDKPFGGWGDNNKSSANTLDSPSTPAKSAPVKSKGSRFASMFKESTQPAKEETPPVDPTTDTQKVANDIASGSAEDEAGFKRILQMLGGTGISQPPAAQDSGPASPPPKMSTNGTKQKSRFTGFFDQTPKSPERMQSHLEQANSKFNDSEGMFPSNRGVNEDPGSMFGGRLSDNHASKQSMRNQGPGATMSPESMMQSINGKYRDQQQTQPPPQGQQGGSMGDIFLDQQQPPSRGTATPDINIQNLLASQRAQRSQPGQDKNSAFLLDLLQTKGSSRPPSQQARPDSNFPLWLDQPPPGMPETHAPKPRAPPPPGLFEDQLLRNAPPEPLRQEQQGLPTGNDMPGGPQRRTSQRAPLPGFYDEQQNLFLHQQQQQAQQVQRRNFTEPPQPQHLQMSHPQQQPGIGRRMSGHPNLPQMQIPPHQHQQGFPGSGVGGPPPDFLQSPGAGGGQVPPPGFNPHMPRHPPGFHNIPNIFSAPQQRPQGTVGEVPPGFGGQMSPPSAGPPGNLVGAPPGFFGGPPQGMQGLQGAGMPPGFAMQQQQQQMQMRSPTEGIPGRGGGRGFDGAAPFDGGGMRRL